MVSPIRTFTNTTLSRPRSAGTSSRTSFSPIPLHVAEGRHQAPQAFSVQSKRSEVLFVDYIAEHLTPTGRAGIIVPEGIVFQSQTAYRELRQMLVEKWLVAVVSLPAGCFNPYSGVKTSILILDTSLARQSDTIAFFRVENDGLGLGAQRRAIDKNDLPQVKAELRLQPQRRAVRRPDTPVPSKVADCLAWRNLHVYDRWDTGVRNS